VAGRVDHVDERAARRVLPAERHLPGGEMDDPPHVVLVHDPADGVAVGDVAAHERHALRHVLAGDHAQSPRILAQIEHDGPLTVGQQDARHPRADAAEAAGDERRHRPETIARGSSIIGARRPAVKGERPDDR
jgi:hypothetical protein